MVRRIVKRGLVGHHMHLGIRAVLVVGQGVEVELALAGHLDDPLAKAGFKGLYSAIETCSGVCAWWCEERIVVGFLYQFTQIDPHFFVAALGSEAFLEQLLGNLVDRDEVLGWWC